MLLRGMYYQRYKEMIKILPLDKDRQYMLLYRQLWKLN